MLAIASGGSGTASHLAALLHRFACGGFAQHVTPLELLLAQPGLRGAAALLLSASGKNKDALSALERCVHEEVPALATISTQLDSPLAKTAARYPRSFVLETEAPSGKDGFLATNSLLAMCVFLARAYGTKLPDDLPSSSVVGADIARERPFMLVLFGGWGAPIATDLESRLSESAIAASQVSDYRNFGHGRHLWLARRPQETVVLTIVTPETSALAERTRDLIPKSIPVVEMRTEALGAAGTIDLLGQSLRLVGELGGMQEFDPGRPSVPDFGRRLYHLSPPQVTLTSSPATARKLWRSLGESEAASVDAARVLFLSRLRSATVGAVALDYDGTLCGHSRADRFGDLRSDLASELRRLLEAELLVGIATGRGRSVREALQKALPRALWDRVVVGYYNGAEIAPLARNEAPQRDAKPVAPLDTAAELLRSDTVIARLTDITERKLQLTIEPRTHLSAERLLAHVMAILAPVEALGVRVLTSSHSVDVLAPNVSKLNVIANLAARMPPDAQVLAIGDRGAWPGNDFAMLAHDLSLSVDDVSSVLESCWNLAPAGVLGPNATLLYLRALSVHAGVGRVSVDALERDA